MRWSYNVQRHCRFFETQCSISLPLSRQDYLVAMATSLDKLENRVQIHHWHVNRFHMVKRLWKSVQYIRRYAKPRRKHAMQFPSGKTTGLMFPNIVHDIVALVMLFNHAYTRCYPIPFVNARAPEVRSLPFFHKIGCHGNVPWDILFNYFSETNYLSICNLFTK